MHGGVVFACKLRFEEKVEPLLPLLGNVKLEDKRRKMLANSDVLKPYPPNEILGSSVSLLAFEEKRTLHASMHSDRSSLMVGQASSNMTSTSVRFSVDLFSSRSKIRFTNVSLLLFLWVVFGSKKIVVVAVTVVVEADVVVAVVVEMHAGANNA